MLYDNGLLEYLQKNGISQSDLSLGSRISNVTISKVCRKKLSPSKTLVGKISQYLIKETNCTASDLKKILPPYVAIKREKIVIEKEAVVKDKDPEIKGKEVSVPKKEKVVKAKVEGESKKVDTPIKKAKAKTKEG